MTNQSNTQGVRGPTSTTDNNFASYNGTTGKVIKDSGKATPTGAVVGTTDTQTLTNKTLTSPNISSIVTAAGNIDISPASSKTTINGATANYALNVAGTGLNARMQFQGSATDNPGVEFTNDTTGTRRTLIRLNESGASGTELQFYTRPDAGGAVSNYMTLKSTGDLQLTTPGNNSGSALTTNGTQTLTNKNLSSSTNTFPDFYPVGTIYTNISNSANPSTYLPGQSGSTWVALTDVFLVARGTTYTSTGGSASHTHSLSTNGYAQITQGSTVIVSNRIAVSSYSTNFQSSISGTGSTGNTTVASALAGNTDSTTNVPPYQAVYTWQRTA